MRDRSDRGAEQGPAGRRDRFALAGWCVTLAIPAALAFGVPRATADDEGRTEAGLVVAVSGAVDRLGDAAKRVGDITSGRLEAGEARRVSFPAPTEGCLTIAARASREAGTVRLTMRRGGTKVADDRGVGRVSVRSCISSAASRDRPRPGGRGDAVRATLVSDRAGAFAVAAFVHPSSAPELGFEPDRTAVEALERRVRRFGEGQPVGAMKRMELEKGQTATHTIALDAGRCYRILAASGTDGPDVQLALYDAEGDRLGASGPAERAATLGVLKPLCPRRGGPHRVKVKATHAPGAIAMRVFVSPASARAASAATTHPVGGSGSGYLAKQLRARHRAVASRAEAVTEAFEGKLRTGEAASRHVRLEGGRCYLVLAAGVPSVRDLDLRVKGPFGREAATDASHDAQPSARVCPTVAGRHTIEVRMFHGYGRYRWQVLRLP